VVELQPREKSFSETETHCLGKPKKLFLKDMETMIRKSQYCQKELAQQYHSLAEHKYMVSQEFGAILQERTEGSL
jgi:hypothetical protein